MTFLNDLPLQKLDFYLTAPYPCSYLPNRMARSLVASPNDVIDTEVYGDLVNLGFRRSGIYTYRPQCRQCHACVPVRIPADEFRPDRAQRRAWKHHGDLVATVRPLEFDAEHYALYRRYQSARHAGGGMDQDSREQYRSFLLHSNIDTRLVEFREGPQLRMLSVVDQLPEGLSLVYTFYEPHLPRASLGTYNILWQVEWCKNLGLPYVYLGYWIAGSRKMAYKSRFRPLEGFVDGRWQLLPDENGKPAK
jgi:arginine-tRNA-protein transferase